MKKFHRRVAFNFRHHLVIKTCLLLCTCVHAFAENVNFFLGIFLIFLLFYLLIYLDYSFCKNCFLNKEKFRENLSLRIMLVVCVAAEDKNFWLTIKKQKFKVLRLPSTPYPHFPCP